jgi:hypothetical protein
VVEVHCVCGRRYPVPDDKAGKKLQCKRCGAINRIPRPEVGDRDDVLIPFRDPGEDEGDDGDDDLGLAPPEPPPLEIRDPLRRCPACGHQDEASVVLCVRCGYDFRTGRRMQDAHEQGERSARVRAASTADAELEHLSGMAWMALTPLGLGLGPYLLARSFAVERQAHLLGREGAALNRLRALALGGLVLWIVALGALGVLIKRRGHEAEEAIDRECRARLERVGRALEAKVEAERRFPPSGGDWSKALAELAGQGSADLSCPVGADLYPFRRRESELLTPQAEPSYLILWEREPHLDATGKLVFRALRFDGRVETFAQRSDLDAATRRPAFGLDGPPPTTTTTPTPADPRPRPGPGPEPVPPAPGERDRVRVAIESFLAYAGSVDDSDPDFAEQTLVDPEFFTERVGIPPTELLPRLLIPGADLDARIQASRMLARLTLPRDFCLTHARAAAKDEAPEVRLGAAVCLHRHGDDAWLPTMASVAEDAAGEETRRVALDWIGREAARGVTSTRRILAHATELRGQTRAAGADALFTLPPAALAHAGALLTDRGVAREAAATLFSAGEAGVEVLLTLLGSERPKDVRQAAFGVLETMRVGGVVKLEDHLRLIEQELDPEVRASAIQGLCSQRGAPAAPLLDWALESLRRGAPGALGQQCEDLLNRAGHGPEGAAALERLVADLSKPGDHAAVLRTLRLAPWRLLDERIDALVAARWERLGDASTKLEVARLLGERSHEGSQRALLLAAADDVEDVRIEALKGLKDALAVRGPELQREAARVVAQRLRVEESPRALPLLIGLASNGIYCELSGEGGREHKCPTALPRALEQLVRKGDRAAIRALRGHPTEKVLEFLLSALDAAREDSIKQEIVGALGALTSVGLTTFDTAEWRKYIAPPSAKVLTRLGDQSRDEAARQRTTQARAESRLEQLRGQAASRPPP